MPSLFDPNLEKALARDRELFQTTDLPIVTVSASFKEDLKGMFGYPEDETLPDIVFSRAHYSMAIAAAVTVWGKKIDPQKAWVVDPTNYISRADWFSIQLTEAVGKTLARYPLLKKVKDFIDSFGRNKLPITTSITPPLLYLTQKVHKPILSFHIAAGNILAGLGKTVVQMVTDPHIRDEYVANIERPNFYLLVFDEKTKTDALEKATFLGKTADPERIIVTGPPVDPRIIAARAQKHPWRNGVLRLCLTTGGLGTNRDEIEKILTQLLPLLRRHPAPYQLMIYAGTRRVILEMICRIACDQHVKYQLITDPTDGLMKLTAPLIILHHPQIVDANELLIKYSFPWAHGFITKPSGDMAYDAVASGSFILTLKEWGIWEHNINEVFRQLGVARRARIDQIVDQLEVLTSAQDKSQSWVEMAMHASLTIDKSYLEGVEHIIAAVKRIKK